MTDREKAEEWLRNNHPFDQQDENGIDLSLLRANLKLTPDERLAQHSRSAKFALELKRGGEAARRRPTA